MTTPRLTFVTVVFEAEFSLLELQARSLTVFVSESLVREILVIDNSARGMSARQRSELLSAYGHFAHMVRVLRPTDICAVPGAGGWRSQQVLKLCVAELITNDRYVVLDAKNHFVADLGLDFTQAPDGRARVNVYGYETHPLRPALEHVLTYLGLDPAPYVGNFTATVTPFVLDTATVRSMVRDIERRSGRTFAEEFVSRDLTEFFLYSGWIVASGQSLESVYDFHQVFCPNVWPHSANVNGVQDAVRAADDRATPLFSVHRKALARLDSDSVSELAGFWTRRGLFASVADAERFVREFQHSYRKTMRMKRLYELPGTLQSLPSRVTRRLVRAARTASRRPAPHTTRSGR